MSKINRGIWCPRRVTRNVKEGQCSGRKGPGKGAESGGRTRSPPGSGGARAAASIQRLRPPMSPWRFQMYGPASWPFSRFTGAVLLLDAPFLDPRGHQRACTGEETGLPRRGAAGL